MGFRSSWNHGPSQVWRIRHVGLLSRISCLRMLNLQLFFFLFQFIAHATCQRQLISLWYSGMPWMRHQHIAVKLLAVPLASLMLPFTTLVFLLAPTSKVGEAVKQSHYAVLVNDRQIEMPHIIDRHSTSIRVSIRHESRVNIGSGNGLLSDDTKPSPEPMALTPHPWRFMTFTWGWSLTTCFR